jgi:hypothetical protein
VDSVFSTKKFVMLRLSHLPAGLSLHALPYCFILWIRSSQPKNSSCCVFHIFLQAYHSMPCLTASSCGCKVLNQKHHILLRLSHLPAGLSLNALPYCFVLWIRSSQPQNSSCCVFRIFCRPSTPCLTFLLHAVDAKFSTKNVMLRLLHLPAGLSLPSTPAVVEPATSDDVTAADTSAGQSSSSSSSSSVAVPGQQLSSAAAENSMLPWSLSEQQQQQQPSAALQAAAKSLSALFHAPAAAEPDLQLQVSSPAQQQQQQQQVMLQWQLYEEEETDAKGVGLPAAEGQQTPTAAAAAAAAAGILVPPAEAGDWAGAQQQQQQQELLLPWSLSETAAAPVVAWPAMPQQQQQQSLRHGELHSQLQQYQRQQEQPAQQQQQVDPYALQKQLNSSEAALLQRIEEAQHPWRVAALVKQYHDAFTPAVTSAALVKLASMVTYVLVTGLQHDAEGPSQQPVSKQHRDSVTNSVSDKAVTTGLGVVAYYQQLMGLDEKWQPLPKQQQQQQQQASSSSSSSSWQQRYQPTGSRSQTWLGPMHHSIQEEDEEDDDTKLQYAVPAAAAGSIKAPSSSSSSSGHAAESAAAAAAAAGGSQQHVRRVNYRLKLLVRCYLRCIDLLESHCELPQGPPELHSPSGLQQGSSAGTANDWAGGNSSTQQQPQQQLSQVSNAALVATARLASRLVGKDCQVHTWWAGARGQLLMAEAAARWKVRCAFTNMCLVPFYLMLSCVRSPDCAIRRMAAAMQTLACGCCCVWRLAGKDCLCTRGGWAQGGSC